MANLQLSGVTKRYRDERGAEVCALDGLDLEVSEGEFLVLVGPSGCGKSTVLRLVAGLEELTAGEIRLGGQVVNALPPKDRDVAMVFQSYALYPHMTVFDNLAYGLKVRGTPSGERRPLVVEVAKLLQLDTCLDRLPKELSGGQRQRVAVGRAILRRPKVFLFDEPLSNLDALLRVQLRIELMRLHQELKTTVVYVTHDQVEAMSMGDRIAVFDQGRLQQVADPKTLYLEPANAFVAGFIGSPPMNLLPQALLREAGLRLPEASVRVGIRAEELRVSGAEVEAGAGPRLRGTVALVEYLGSESIVHVSVGEQRVLARAAEGDWKRGDAVALSFDASRVHLFDAEHGRRLDPSGPA